MALIRSKLLLPCTAVLLVCAADGLAHEQVETAVMRIAIVRGGPSVLLQAKALTCGLPNDTAEWPQPLPMARAMVRATGVGFLVNEQFFDASHIICKTGGSLLLINGRPSPPAVELYHGGDQHLTAVIQVPMQEYLVGVLSAELQPSWPAEALRAQAVTARSYALAQRQKQPAALTVYDLESSVEDQAYSHPGYADPRIIEAVDATRGEVLTVNGHLLKAYYHSHCGGITEPAANVWGETAAQGFSPIRDPYCARAPNRRWRLTLHRDRLQAALAAAGHKVAAITGLKTTPGVHSDRIALVTVETDGDPVQFSGNQFRRLLGFQELKSTLFTLRARGNRWIIDGRGFGHGAGLCQWGAKGMAERGKSYREILAFYYPGSSVMNWY
ncbi:MAG: SpoIID/LytB domain-containing protein [Deltaproteobacteria bacterium]|nr:SpoIID/LytB domain-containing protein [Deltaproteobacteria bacterium]